MQIEGSDISTVWARAFIAVSEAPHQSISPLTVIVDLPNTENSWEDPSIRSLLDRKYSSIRTLRRKSINTIANTIFPNSIWNPNEQPCDFFARFEQMIPRILASCPENRNGTYLQRMVAFDNQTNQVNQLEVILASWRAGTRRRSAFQASIFDPRRDHRRGPYLGFPCLQQVAFIPLGPNGINGLAVSAFYGTQYMFEKAYGNYVGLCRLGRFMSNYMGLRLVRLACYASVAEKGDHIGSSEARKLSEKLKKLLSER